MSSKLRGTGSVFKFSYIQQLKSRSFIIGTFILNGFFIVLLLIANFANFLSSGTSETANNIVVEKTSDNVEDTIKKVYYVDATALNLDFAELSRKYSISFSDVGIPEHMSDNEVSVVISNREYGYDVVANCGAGVSGSAVNTLIDEVSQVVREQNYKISGLTPEKLKAANAVVTTSIVDEHTNIGTFVGTPLRQGLRTMVASLLALIMFMFVIIYGQLVGQSVATEKTSKVIELLLVSAKPLAIIIGKVFAMGAVAFTQIIATVLFQIAIAVVIAPMGALSGVGAALAAHNFTPTTAGERIISDFSYVLSYVNVGTVLLSVSAFVFGYLFYAMLSGLAASCISRQEDLQAAMQPMALTGLLGLYLAYVLPTMSIARRSASTAILLRVSYYLPVSSPFALPGAILTGEVRGWEILLAIAVLVVFDVLFVLFVARVYHHTILHSGERIKFGSLIKFSRVR